MTDLDYPELRRIAEAATPGPWEVLACDSGVSYRALNASVITARSGDEVAVADWVGEYDDPHAGEGCDARHIAAFDPPTALALLDDVERLRADRDLIIRAHQKAARFADQTFNNWQQVVAERDALAAKMARAEALIADCCGCGSDDCTEYAWATAIRAALADEEGT